jgi:hypothetical protein
MDDTITRLEDWCHGHKARWVEISIDDGYGATCWCVTLGLSQNKKIEAYETSFFVLDNAIIPPEVVFVHDGESDGDFPGLTKTINAAIDRAESLGHLAKSKRQV